VTAASPTQAQFEAYRQMFDYFNAALFGGSLRPVLLNFSRHAGSYGFFAPERWHDAAPGAEVKAHEISLNPSHLATRSPIQTASTLVHEMCHLWQQDHGTPPRRGYHDREWSAKMAEVGLVTVCPKTGKEKRSAPALTHRIEEGGAFERAFRAMPEAFLLPWSSSDGRPRTAAGGATGAEGKAPEAPKSRNKVKYSCPGCAANVWGKPGLSVLCGECGESFAEAG
jgi:hypothetical protein